jgi:prepilin-type N-terminal cleavage/methylation domain-containing protein
MIAVTSKMPVGESPLRAAERGFTLTEIAIVLGIIGLILGAIWVAAAAVYNNMRVSTANTELLQIAQAVRSMYATQTIVDQNADMSFAGTGAQGNKTYMLAGVFPSNALDAGDPQASARTVNPWSGPIVIQAASSPTAGGTNDSFAVTFDAIPSQGCIDILSSATGTGRDPGMWAAGGGGQGGQGAQNVLVAGQPLGANNIAGQCSTAANGNAATFWFNLRAGT